MSVTLRVQPRERGQSENGVYTTIYDFSEARQHLGTLEDAPGFDPARVQQVTVECIADPAFRYMITTPNGNSWWWDGRACDEQIFERRWRNLRNGNTDRMYIYSFHDFEIALTNYYWEDGNPQGLHNGDPDIYYIHFRRVRETDSRFCAVLQDLHERVSRL